jgi:pimeloyl-ACP methyl ester carboxylesterase
MIARLLRLLWIVTIVTMALAAWLFVRLFAAYIGPLASGLAAIALIAAFHPAGIAFNFVWSRLAGDPAPPEHRLSLWRIIKTFDAEIDASMRGVWFANPFLSKRLAPTPAFDASLRSRPILFIHGYFCNRAVWHSFMKDAAARGYRCEAVTLANPFASIESHDAVIDDAIDALLATTTADTPSPARDVLIVAHSMGGLVARTALQRIDRSRVAHVVTLGSPHHGAVSARFGRSACLVQMRRGSPWLADLDRAETIEHLGLSRARLTNVFSYHDDVVFPQTTSCLEGAENIAIGGRGHVTLLYDRLVRTIVFDRLALHEESFAATQADSVGLGS